MYAVHLSFHASFSVCLMMSFNTRQASLSVSFGVMTVYLLVSVSVRHASVSANFSVLAVHLSMSLVLGYKYESAVLKVVVHGSAQSVLG